MPGSVDEVERAIRSGADGIGLFRSEFLYMQRQDGFPDEQVQTAAYARPPSFAAAGRW